VEPDPTGFVERHGWPQAQAWATREYTPLLDAVGVDTVFSFRSRVNPVRHVRDADGQPSSRGRRVGHVTADQQLRWFSHRATDWGFTVGAPEEPTATVVDRKVWRFDRGGRQVTLATAAVEGTLTVIDPEIFRRKLVEGIGPAKAYGCGLLTLAAPR
jgi:CRISPR system Cascade subunit CasE